MKIAIITLCLGIYVWIQPKMIAKHEFASTYSISGVSEHPFQEVMKDTSIIVYGNCSSCKKAIEKAAKSVAGVESATWDKKKKILTIQYDTAKTSLDLIEKAIIAIGYDTENMRAEDSVYDELHHCCKYDRKPR